jgi:4-hydroxybenzoate polyprenyltransferase
MHYYKTLFIISRPRFWIYLLGPYLIGIAAAYQEYSVLPITMVVVWWLYFVWPANLLIYGVNDLSDHDTDQYNPKKNWYEHQLQSDFSFILIISIIKRNLPFLLMGLFVLSWAQLGILWLFLVLGIWYSLKPLRFKSRPFLDAISNSFYILPGLFSYLLIWATGINWSLVIAGCLRAIAMHAYSAVPDIISDRKANLQTIATTLWKNATLYLCWGLYALAAILSWPMLGIYALWSGVIYLWVIIFSIQQSNIFSIYRWFPVINMLIGCWLFWYIIRIK